MGLVGVGGPVQRCFSEVVAGVDVGTCIEEDFHHFEMAAACCVVQGGIEFFVDIGAGVAAVFKDVLDHLDMAVAGGEHEIFSAEGIAAETLLVDTRTRPALKDSVSEDVLQELSGHSGWLHEEFEVGSELLGPDAADKLRKASKR